jgi:DNA polymerase eta
VQVPVAHGKADIQIYRDAGAAVISVLSSGAICERASVDEAYLDVTAGAQQLLAAAAAAAGGSGAAGEAVQAQLGGGGTEEEQQELGIAAAAAVGALLPLPESIERWHVADVVGDSLD